MIEPTITRCNGVETHVYQSPLPNLPEYQQLGELTPGDRLQLYTEMCGVPERNYEFSALWFVMAWLDELPATQSIRIF